MQMPQLCKQNSCQGWGATRSWWERQQRWLIRWWSKCRWAELIAWYTDVTHSIRIKFRDYYVMFVKQKFCFFVNNNDTMLCKTMKTLLKYSGIFYFKKQLIWVYFVTVTGQNRQRLWKKIAKLRKSLVWKIYQNRLIWNFCP